MTGAFFLCSKLLCELKISIEGLTKRQQEIVTTMIIEFRSERKAGVKRLTTRQTDIIRDYIFEITSDR